MRERDLIKAVRALRPDPPGVTGIGDDCCVWTPGGATCLSVDAIVENRHFLSTDAPELVGRKAAGAALSDLAFRKQELRSRAKTIDMPAIPAAATPAAPGAPLPSPAAVTTHAAKVGT